MAKYDPLEGFLNSLPYQTDSTQLTFEEIEDMIGSTLPKSARNYSAWWANQTNVLNRPQARAWTDAGFEVFEVNLRTERITFHRSGT
jgi:hypothetical protein